MLLSVNLDATEASLLALLAVRSERNKVKIAKSGDLPRPVPCAYGTRLAQERARMFLDLLRDSKKDMKAPSSAIKKMAYDIAKRVVGEDEAAETAKKLLRDMVHRSMELRMNNMEHVASSATLSPQSASCSRQ